MKANKKTTTEIKSFYQNKEVVKIYDNKRFSGYGGKYVDNIETDSILRYVKNFNSVLELGSGTGRLTRFLIDRVNDLVCLDASLEMLKLLKKKVKVKKTVNQSIFDKIKVSRKFDAITALRFFDHFSISDQNKIIKNALPVMKKNGNFIYSALNSKSSESVLSTFFYFSKTNYFYSYEEYKKMFLKNKLHIVSFHSDFFFPRGIYLRFKTKGVLFKFISYFDRWLVNMFPKYGSLYTFVLEDTK